MPRHLVKIVGLGLIVLALSGLWWWSNRPTPVTTTHTQTATHSSEPPDNFLPIDLAHPISLQAILENSFVIPAGTNMNQVVTIVTTGDVIPARGVDMQIRAQGPDYPFEGDGMDVLLSQADLTIVNLESPLIASCPVTKQGFTFCGQPSFATSMAKVGIDVATLENNHIGNYNTTGIKETIQHLADADVRYATAEHLDIETIKGLKVGILAFNGVGGRFNTDEIKQVVVAARAQVDILLVAFHWGKEYELVPVADPAIAPDDPRAIGRLAVDSGADIVVGNHPHWVQGVELYKGKLISYALGNFIFDQSWSVPTQQGMVARYTFYGKKLLGMSLTPIHIDNQARPRVAYEQEQKQILTQFRQSTMLMATSSAIPAL